MFIFFSFYFKISVNIFLFSWVLCQYKTRFCLTKHLFSAGYHPFISTQRITFCFASRCCCLIYCCFQYASRRKSSQFSLFYFLPHSHQYGLIIRRYILFRHKVHPIAHFSPIVHRVLSQHWQTVHGFKRIVVVEKMKCVIFSLRSVEIHFQSTDWQALFAFRYVH